MSFEDIRPHDVPELQIQPLAETPEITHVPDTNIEAVNRELERINEEDEHENQRQQEIQKIIDGDKPESDRNEHPEHPTIQ